MLFIRQLIDCSTALGHIVILICHIDHNGCKWETVENDLKTEQTILLRETWHWLCICQSSLTNFYQNNIFPQPLIFIYLIISYRNLHVFTLRYFIDFKASKCPQNLLKASMSVLISLLMFVISFWIWRFESSSCIVWV